MIVIVSSVLYLYLLHSTNARSIDDLSSFNLTRNNLIEADADLSLGSLLELTHDEIQVNNVLMKYKEQELNEAFSDPAQTKMSQHYFAYRNDILKSKVYQLIRRMPKGALLHVHSSLMVGADFMLNMTYLDNLFACVEGDDVQLQFSLNTPLQPCSANWTLLSQLRDDSDDIQAFDSKIKSLFTLYSEDELDQRFDLNTIWTKFEKVCSKIKSLIDFEPVREMYIWEAFKRLYNDNVMYVEIRGSMNDGIYDLNGTQYDSRYLVRLYKRIAEKFTKTYPDFVGFKIIISKYRGINNIELQQQLLNTIKMKAEMPDVIAGFDLVGQEDLGKPLKEFLPQLQKQKDNLDYYFHGGETNWYGSESDENLFDAILLGTKRIGHGYALLKHPSLIAAVSHKNIAIEVNVISNVVLSLVNDVRNHPLATYIAFGLPVVISSDDPGAWEADPLSFDFYVTFVRVASRHSDLRLLKQLALNSIQYSALDSEMMLRLSDVFERRWDRFLKEVPDIVKSFEK